MPPDDPWDGELEERIRDALREREEVAFAYLHGALVRSLGERRDPGHPAGGVDLFLLNRAPPLLSERVLREGELVWSRGEAARIRWMVGTKRRYCDLRRVWARLDRAVEERLRSGNSGRPAPPTGVR